MTRGESRLNILMVASEAAPWAKTGGLGDVTTALSDALARLGHRVRLVIPRYRGIAVRGAPVARLDLSLGRHDLSSAVFEEATASGTLVWFLDCPALFDREGLYGIGPRDHADNARRFAWLALAALECQARSGERPTVVHAHDWQTGLVPVYLRTRYREHPTLGRSGTVFSIHNLAFQGLFGAEWIAELDLAPEVLHVDAAEFWGRISFLKAGINFSDRITTVSPRYAKEILTPEFGFGFEGVLARRRRALTGILNGIDTATWDPRRDPHLPVPFDSENLSGKTAAKRAALAAFGLSVDRGMSRPLLAMIMRLVDQKGLDLLVALREELSRLDATIAVLGTGDIRYEEFWRTLAAEHPDRIAARIAFDERLSHVLEAGADLFLMPSRFEPCGLNQMYSLRYGTVPVVRSTGGLADTVRDIRARRGRANGFTFREYAPQALLGALNRALTLYRTDPAAWRRLQVAGMQADHSWDGSAREYVTVYERAAANALRRRNL